MTRESLAKVQPSLEWCQRGKENSKGWHHSLFDAFHWLTTLILSLLGTLIILLLLLTFGPCTLSKLIAFIKDQIGAEQLMALGQRYETLRTGPEECELPKTPEHSSWIGACTKRGARGDKGP